MTLHLTLPKLRSLLFKLKDKYKMDLDKQPRFLEPIIFRDVMDISSYTPKYILESSVLEKPNPNYAKNDVIFDCEKLLNMTYYYIHHKNSNDKIRLNYRPGFIKINRTKYNQVIANIIEDLKYMEIIECVTSE